MPTRDVLKLTLMIRACQWVDGMGDAEVAGTKVIRTFVGFGNGVEPLYALNDDFESKAPGLTEAIDPHAVFSRHFKAIDADIHFQGEPDPDEERLVRDFLSFLDGSGIELYKDNRFSRGDPQPDLPLEGRALSDLVRQFLGSR